jgi:hypothetical protein
MQELITKPATSFPLPTSHFPLPTSNFQLPTSSFPLNSKCRMQSQNARITKKIPFGGFGDKTKT